MFTRRVSVQLKLLGVAALLLSFTTIIAIVGISSLATVDRIAEEMYVESTQPLEELGVARAKANENRALLNNHILASSTAEMEELERSIAANERLIEERFRRVEPTLQTREGKAAFAEIERHLADYRAAREGVLAISRGTDRRTAVRAAPLMRRASDLNLEKAVPIFKDAAAGFDKLFDSKVALASDENEEIEETFAAKLTLSLVLLFLALVLGIAAVFLVSRQNLALTVSRRQAATDELTGLCNRRGFYAQAEHAVTAAAREESASVALLLLDLDSFKEFNDTLGHHAGDEVLRHFAERLRTALPDAQLLARLGGDEFVALLGPGADAGDAVAAGRRLFAALEEPVPLDGLMAHVNVSIGIATAPEHGSTRTDLLRHADLAMYRAKQQGTGMEIYDAVEGHNSPDRLRLASDLRTALKADELVVHYQPKADLPTGSIVGVEALVRWQHPSRGLLSPDTFLPLAERYGLMRELTHLVLERALDQHRAWLEQGLVLPVAVNVSPVNLLDTRFPDEVVALLEAADLPAEALQLEITENTIMVDPARVLDVLARLSEHGISLALDDFGTGYSSLAYLRGLPVQELKIDKSFVLEMTTSHQDRAIVRSTIDLVRNLGLRVVAEGVETEETWEQLRGFGCHSAQGFYLSRPLAADELTEWLSCRTRESAAPDRLRHADRAPRAC